MESVNQALAMIEKSGRFDLSKLSSHNASLQDITSYYSQSHIGYKLFHSLDGAIHMALSSGQNVRRSDYLGQAQIVAQHIDDNTHSVLELACGNGFNSIYLAKKFPNIQFAGLDLTPTHIKQAKHHSQRLPNVSWQIADFHRMPFGQNQFDLIFIIESLCHAQNMVIALTEAQRVLKPGGQFIVIDGYRSHQFDTMPANIKRASRLVEASMELNTCYPYSQWRQLAIAQGFNITQEADLTQRVLPSMLRLHTWANLFFRRKLIRWLAPKLFSPLLIQNAIAGLLLAHTMSAGAHSYWATTLAKPTSHP